MNKTKFSIDNSLRPIYKAKIVYDYFQIYLQVVPNILLRFVLRMLGMKVEILNERE
jgi:hypothetical protein